ncbi:MAG: TonB-dependent receptor [Bacteroidia bacterium]|nr:TonB-dependent receptor [Bacteroidia bacterium]
MKKINTIIIVLILLLLSAKQTVNAAKTSLEGKVTNKATGETIVGAYIYIPDLKTGAVSSIDGTYKIDNLPQIKMLVKVSLVGYKTIIETVDLSVTTNKNFTLEESIIDINEVLVTGITKSTELKRNPVPIVSIDSREMDRSINTNIIDAIAKLPGVNAVTTGPNISKPFIRGLGYNRVLTLFDGIRQEGQQWGNEHGIEVDQNAVDRVEVIKGPASLMYGSDALAGVINLLPALPAPEGKIEGSVMANYQSNNGLYASSASMAGNMNGIIWGMRFSHKEASNYRNKYDGRVYGTSFNETDANGYIGINRYWGYSHLNFSVYDDAQSVPDGSRDSLTRKFTRQINEADTVRPIVSTEQLNSYKIPVIYQRIQHYRIYSTNNFILGSSKLTFNLGYQQNVRREFNHPLAPDIAGLFLSLQTCTYDLNYFLPEWNDWITTMGVNGMYQWNTNKGTAFIIPDYILFDLGPFVHTKKTFGKLDVAAGIRCDQRVFNSNDMYVKTNPATGFDMQTILPDTIGSSHIFSSHKHIFNGFSGSVGATYNFSDNFLLKINIARGFRAPTISELSANGVHPGTTIYQLGNADFRPEFSLQEDIGLCFSTEHISGSVELFNNDIQNYIYNQKVLNKQGGDSIVVPGNQTFRFSAARARLWGGEFSIDVHPHPLDWLHFENALSVVYAANKGVGGIAVTDSEKYLPQIPPVHSRSELRADIHKKWKCFSSIYFKLDMEWYAAQNRVYLAYNTESPTPGYILFDAGFGTDVLSKSGKKLVSLHLLGSNITNVAYQSHLSRLKYFEPYPVNGSGHSGIYNMGRNISIKLIVPLNIRE